MRAATAGTAGRLPNHGRDCGGGPRITSVIAGAAPKSRPQSGSWTPGSCRSGIPRLRRLVSQAYAVAVVVGLVVGVVVVAVVAALGVGIVGVVVGAAVGGGGGVLAATEASSRSSSHGSRRRPRNRGRGGNRCPTGGRVRLAMSVPPVSLAPGVRAAGRQDGVGGHRRN